MRTVKRWLVALALVGCGTAPAAAQTNITIGPYLNNGGIAKGSITIPAASDLRIVMAAPAVTTPTPGAAGTLDNGVYTVSLVALDAGGGTTAGGATATCTTVAGAGAGSCSVAYSTVVGAVSYRVYYGAVGSTTLDRYMASTSSPLVITTTTVGGAVVSGAVPTSSTAFVVNVDSAGTSWFKGSDTFSFGGAANLVANVEAAAILQLGTDVNGAAVAQTLKAHDGITGTDIAGAAFTLASGRGTGAATGSTFSVQTPVTGTTGTTAQTLSTKLSINQAGTAAFTPTGLTGSQATSGLTLTQTWNTSGAPTAIFANITDTASAAGSLLADLQVGSVSKFSVGKNGLMVPNGSQSALPITFSADTDTGWYNEGNNIVVVVGNTKISELGAYRTLMAPAAVTGAGTTNGLAFAQTWNTTGVIDGAVRIAITDTASGASSLPFAIYGGASATTSLFKVSKAGKVTAGEDVVAAGSVFAAAEVTGSPYLGSSYVGWKNYSLMRGNATDGVITFLNNAATGFTRLNFGGTTSAFPALAVTSATPPTLTVIAGDGSSASNFSVTGTLNINGAPASAAYAFRAAVPVTAQNGFNFIGYQASAAGPDILFQKTRNAAVGSHTIVADGDQLGRLIFQGSDGVGFRDAFNIHVEVDGAPGTNDMPGRLVFYATPDGSVTPAEAMRIGNNKLVTLAGNLIVSGAGPHTLTGGITGGCTGTPTVATAGVVTTCVGPEYSPLALAAMIQSLQAENAALRADMATLRADLAFLRGTR